MSNNNIKVNDRFSIMIEKPLTEYDRKTLNNLYLPIVGSKAITLLSNFHSLVLLGEHESLIENFDKLVKIMDSDLIDIEKMIHKLEGIGLINTYYSDNLYLYYLKDIPTPTKFFQNELLSQALISYITKEEYEKIVYELLLRRLDVNKFTEITRSFDDEFEIEEEISHLDPLSLSIKTSDGVVIKNEHFDYKHFIIFVSALGIIDEKRANDTELFAFINRYSFMYHLTEEEMSNALLSAISNNEIDYEKFKINIKRIYTNKGRNNKVVNKVETTEKDDKLISYLETASPNDIVISMYNESMTTSEIETMDRLLVDTGINLGMLNVALIYVLKEKNGEIPTYNYFLKIIKTWKRAGVTNAKEAIEHLDSANKPKETKNNYKEKTKKDVPSWYDNYLKKANEKLNQQIDKTNNIENTSDLDDFFKSNNKEK